MDVFTEFRELSAQPTRRAPLELGTRSRFKLAIICQNLTQKRRTWGDRGECINPWVNYNDLNDLTIDDGECQVIYSKMIIVILPVSKYYMVHDRTISKIPIANMKGTLWLTKKALGNGETLQSNIPIYIYI